MACCRRPRAARVATPTPPPHAFPSAAEPVPRDGSRSLHAFYKSKHAAGEAGEAEDGEANPDVPRLMAWLEAEASSKDFSDMCVAGVHVRGPRLLKATRQKAQAVLSTLAQRLGVFTSE